MPWFETLHFIIIRYTSRECAINRAGIWNYSPSFPDFRYLSNTLNTV